MLTSLAVTNYALVQNLELDFAPGFTSISGETGAGKSLMMAALGLVLGDKPKILESDHCQICAEFALQADSPAATWLDQHGIHEQYAVAPTALLRRSFTNKRSKAFINGAQTGVGELTQLGDLLVSMHSQHQHHALLQRAHQRRMLDAYAGTTMLAGEVAKLHARSQQLRKSLEDSVAGQQLAERELALLHHHLAELEALAPQEGEYEELDQAHRRASQRQYIQELLHQLLAELEGDNEQSGTLARLHKTRSELAALGISATSELANTLAAANALLEDTAGAARHQADNESNHASQAELEARISSYHQLARKHQCKAQELVNLQTRLHHQAEQLSAQATAPETLTTQLADCRQSLAYKASELRRQRSESATILEAKINALLPLLAMPDATFSIVLEVLEEPSPQGYEQPFFCLQTSNGGNFLPLQSIASGGELSRVSLALYLACTDATSPMTMVFDEVDTGLSGKVSATVGTILKQLAQRHQVLCITHQPQIVALADQHLSVCKQTHAGKSQIQVKQLDSDGAIAEIARMLGATGEIAASTVRLAQEMYHHGRKE